MARQCEFAPCERQTQARGLCSSHYHQWWKGLPLTAIPPKKTVTERFWEKVNKTDDCWLWTGCSDGRFKVDSHLLSAHRWAYADFYGEIPDGLPLVHKCGTEDCVRPEHLEPAWGTRPEMFWAKVEKTDTCWLWVAGLTPNGYGQFGIGWPRTALAHRWAYEETHGPIPDGMQIDHICRVRTCVRPEHLRVVTNKQNHENIVAQKRSKTGARGVYYDRRGYYYVQVTHNGQRHCRGTFATKAEAERVAIALRNELFTHNDTDRAVS